ncbi:MAG: sigma-70 family RNA polymerase sigma factor [Gemmataceae bacterium]|nr:sigma-70 family RNA polymerase sigma factor [Gemmataceae bacterium]MDW8263848.1 sigma-70 family RNA polymerase sigma factor [Gemmataceae bacterium]
MPLTPVDRALLQRCLRHEAGAWEEFVQRFLGLIYHVVHYTAHLRGVPLTPEDTEDLAAEILLGIIANDYAVLRQFRGQSSLATYLTVIARRLCVHELVRRQSPGRGAVSPRANLEVEDEGTSRVQAGLEKLEEVQQLLRGLRSTEREVVRLYYLEGRSYEEISTELNIPVNSIGPILSRARQKLRAARSAPPGAGGKPPRA